MFYQIYEDANRQWRWYLQSANGKKIANSGEGYHNRADCKAAIKLVQGSNTAPVREP